MIKLLPILLTLGVLFSATEGWSADFQKGMVAYKEGDYATALREWRPLAEQGDADAQNNLGVMYAETPQDYTLAHMWWSIAASQGNKRAKQNQDKIAGMMTPSQITEAQKLSRECVENNYKGCEKKDSVVSPEELRADFQKGTDAAKRGDYATALREWRPLAEQGDAKAQYSLGVMYKNGMGVIQDSRVALKWWRLAANKGLAEAQFNLGQMYQKGEGVAQDNKVTAKWWRFAAEQGFTDAQFNLGVMYDKGWGVPEDDKEAVKWWKLAAEQKYSKAQNELGGMYAMGDGTLRDYTRAHMWWGIAASQGDNRARQNRDKIAGMMTPSQIAEAQKLSRECVENNYKGC